MSEKEPEARPPNDQSCHSYLLRLWPTGGAWRASLQDARTGDSYGFKSLEDLFSFVEVKTKEARA